MLTLALVAGSLAVLLILPPRASQLSRLGAGRKTQMPKWLAGRDDALSIQTRAAMGLGVGACLLVAVPGPVGSAFGLIGAIGTCLALGHLETGASRIRRQRLLRQQPLALTFLAASLRAGAPLRVATAEVGDVSPPETSEFLAGINARVSVGVTEAEAWLSAQGDDAWGEIAKDVARAASNGTMLANLLDTHAGDARERFSILRQTAAKKVGVKVAMPMMCCFLPSFICVGVAPIVASLLERFIQSPPG